MLVNMVVFTLVASTITGSWADVSNDKVADAVLNYLTLQSTGAKNSLFTIQLSDLKKELNALIDENPKSVNVEDLKSKLSIFAKLIYVPMTPDYKTIQLQLQREMEQLRMKLSPLTGVVNKQFSKFIEELKSTLVSCDLERQDHLEKSSTALNEILKNVALDLDSKIMEKADKFSLAPYSKMLQILMTETLNKLIKNIQFNVEKMSEKIDEKVLTLYESLSPLAEDMQDALRKETESMTFQIKKSINEVASKILDNTAQLKNILSVYADLIKEENNLDLRYAKKTLDLYIIKINQKTEAFKYMVTFYGDILNQALLKQVVDLKKKLVEGAISDLEKDFPDKISNLNNNTLLLT